MSKLAKCPLCGKQPTGLHQTQRSNRASPMYVQVEYIRCCYTTHRSKWNRIARLVRKGRMFEWLERYVRTHKAKALHGQVSENGKTALRIVYVYMQKAREWWRKRRKK